MAVCKEAPILFWMVKLMAILFLRNLISFLFEESNQIQPLFGCREVILHPAYFYVITFVKLCF
jgi:hypothetical protein